MPDAGRPTAPGGIDAELELVGSLKQTIDEATPVTVVSDETTEEIDATLSPRTLTVHQPA